MSGAGPRCGHWIGAEGRYCLAAESVRRFVVGLRCPAHTPNAVRGRPEIPAGPGLPARSKTT